MASGPARRVRMPFDSVLASGEHFAQGARAVIFVRNDPRAP
jgi:hypothetical protein